jgi:hypothetical protein
MKQWNPDNLKTLHRTAPGDPHCPDFCGVRCPPECPYRTIVAVSNGCHLCDCLQGKYKDVK